MVRRHAVSALERDVYLSGLPITVTVNEGVITLEGTVGNAYEKEKARNDVRLLSHVKSVENNLTVEW